MLDPRYVADHLDGIRAGLLRRSSEAAAPLEAIAKLSASRRAIIVDMEARQAQRNQESQAMSQLAKSGDKTEFAAKREALKVLADEIKALEEKLKGVEGEMEELLAGVPNVPHETVPTGTGEADNTVVRTWGTRPTFDFEPQAHWDLGARLGILDLERAAKLSGARFALLKGAGARLERALITFMLDVHTKEHGYTEVAPPYLVKAEALFGTGQLPKFEMDLFKTYRREGADKDALYLIPTAEVPVTNIHANQILEGAELPLAYTAFTPCFRSEAGSYGKDVRGLIRLHQFDKVELVRFVEPETGAEQLELLTGHAEAILQRLGLHYRVVTLCSGDLGFSATKTYDLEVWLPAHDAFREISSCSWFTDFQARRAKIRYRPAPKAKARLVHTLNGSGLAVGRTLVAILEQYQRSDGSVVVPEPLRELVGADVLEPTA